MKYSILLVLLLIVSLNASAQMFSGRVLDDQKIPVQYATVALLSVADSSLISGTVTDEQGIFKIEVSESKSYLLAVSYVGCHHTGNGIIRWQVRLKRKRKMET